MNRPQVLPQTAGRAMSAGHAALLAAPPAHDDADELAAGLQAASARIASRYLYDPLGCRLFELITALPEYYPTRTEQSVLEDHADEIAAAVGRCQAVIDLGAGNCAKAGVLLKALHPRHYVAVDISPDFVRQSLTKLRKDFYSIRLTAVGADLRQEFLLPQAVPKAGRLFFYPGSSIGNFEPEAAPDFLRRIRGMCSPGDGLLIGIDLVKEKSILDAAYNDALGLTAAFNLNVLNHVNALLGSDFDTREWRHRAFYNCARGRIEMHLQAMANVSVGWPGGGRNFLTGESIHTENSYKYRLSDFEALLVRAGFTPVQAWTDPQEWFGVCLARA